MRCTVQHRQARKTFSLHLHLHRQTEKTFQLHLHLHRQQTIIKYVKENLDKLRQSVYAKRYVDEFIIKITI